MVKYYQKENISDDLLQYFEPVPAGPIPPTCLDPFWGSGTVSLVAERMGIDSIGCELNPEYVNDIGVPRVVGDCPMFVELEVVNER